MDPALKAARLEIASEVGADVGNFTPPDQKRFTGVEIMLVVGGELLYGFLKGLAKKVGEKVGEKVGDKVGEKIGEPLAAYVGDKIDELAGKDKTTQDRLLEEAQNEAKKKIQGAGLNSAQVKEAAQTVETQMVITLSAKAPKEISVRIARKVTSAGVGVL